MRRAWIIFAMATLVSLAGCGKKSYEERLGKTLAKLEYDRRLKKNVMDPPKDNKKFTELAIYVRPPKEEVLAQTGQLPINEGSFDLDASFNDAKEANAAMHVLARVKMPKKLPAKGAAPVATPPPRAEFVSEVLGVLSTAYGSPEALQTPKFSDESRKGGNRFKRLIFTGNDKEVKLYTLKQGNHEVALVFAYDPKLKNQLSSKIEYTLDSFAIGEKANRLYSGGTSEEEGEGGPPIVL